MRLTELQLAAIQAKQGTSVKKPITRRHTQHIEDDHQRTVISWADYTRLDSLKHPVLCGSVIGDYLFAIPNGGKRDKQEAARMQGLGTRAGIPDLMLALPCQPYTGLFIEIKRPILRGEPKPTVSPDQMDKLKRFAKAGYFCCVAYGCDEAQQYITNYIEFNLSEDQNMG